MRFSAEEIAAMRAYVEEIMKEPRSMFELISLNQKQAKDRYENYLKGNDDKFNEIKEIVKKSESWFKFFTGAK
jgi:hypothetical protein